MLGWRAGNRSRQVSGLELITMVFWKAHSLWSLRMGLVGKIKEVSRPGRDRAKGRAHAWSKRTAAAQLWWNIALWACSSNVFRSSSYSRKAGNLDIFFGWNLLIFKCWKLIENFKNTCRLNKTHSQAKMAHRLPALASSLKEMSRIRNMEKTKTKNVKIIQSFLWFPSTTWSYWKKSFMITAHKTFNTFGLPKSCGLLDVARDIYIFVPQSCCSFLKIGSTALTVWADFL